MKRKSVWLLFLISIIPILFALMCILDMRDVVYGQDDYAFGSEFFSSGSIHSSRTLYVTYHLIEIILLLLMVYYTFKQRWKPYYILLGINILLFLYPFLTAEYY
jgi:hypothetical protein